MFEVTRKKEEMMDTVCVLDTSVESLIKYSPHIPPSSSLSHFCTLFFVHKFENANFPSFEVLSVQRERLIHTYQKSH